MAIGWADVLKIAVSSSVLTAAVTWSLDHFFVRRAALRRDARYLAQRVAVVLERYATDCASYIADNQLHTDSDGHAGESRLTLPPIAPFPTDTDWKAIDSDLVDRALSFPTELELADQAILFWWNVVGDEDCMRTETDNQAGTCGMKAWLLAAELRKRYRIPASKLPGTTWDFVATLRKHAEAAETQRRAMRSEKGDTPPRSP